MSRTLKLTISYDGTRFVGWQRQSSGESIQGHLEDALARFEGGPVTVYGAGRTDAGVHALGQVASARVTSSHTTSELCRGLNASLPSDIRVLRVDEVADDFHARFNARSKTYRYLIRNAEIVSPFERPYVWHLPEPLDVHAMRTAASTLVGTYDFAVFRSVGTETKDTIRTITRSEVLHVPPPTSYIADLTRSAPHDETWSALQDETFGQLIAYEVTGNGFLRYMVRAIVGTLVEVGRGWRAGDSMPAMLASATRAKAGATAPAHGLFLVGVDYH